MNETEAREIVKEKVLAKRPGFSLLVNSTKEFTKCFVYYYQTDAYIRSGSIHDMCVGPGPVIVCKVTGKCFETASTYSTEKYVEAFEKCGDPYGQITTKILIMSWVEGANAVKAISCIKNASNLNLLQAKLHIDSVLNGGNAVVELESISKVEGVVKSLSQFGFNSKQLWSNQC